MIKRLALFSLVLVFMPFSSSLAAQNYEEELAAQKQALKEVMVGVADLTKQLTALKVEYVNADIKLRQELAADAAKLAATKGEANTNKEIIRKSKERQAELRKVYYEKKKPLSLQMNELKTEAARYNKKIKELEKKIKMAQEGREEDEEYLNQIAELRDQLNKAKEELMAAIGVLREAANEKIAAITDKENKAKFSKEVMTETKDKEVNLWREFNKKKGAIGEQIKKVKVEYRARVQAKRQAAMQKLAEQKAQQEAPAIKTDKEGIAKKGPACNFGPRK